MMETTGKQHWYVARTRTNQEYIIKAKLEALGVEHFLPEGFRTRETATGRERVRVPLIRGMIFIRTDKSTSFSLLNDHFLRMSYVKDIEGRHSLVVPDNQMAAFMRVVEVAATGIEVLNQDLRRGDRVRVIEGPLAGLEGELSRSRGHKRVVIRLEGVASIATSYIPGAFLEKIQ